MKLLHVLEGLRYELVGTDPEIEIVKVHFDSREVGPGDLFVAQRGVHSDGHNYISSAIAAGATAVVCEKLPDNLSPGVVFILTDNSSEALGIIASNYYGKPSERLKLIGVTGTNGKTTIATLLYEMMRLLGHNSGLISTVCNYIGEKRIKATHTTPDALEINALLRKIVDAGCDYCFMEVSSHAIDQRRIAGLLFTGVIFTNITHEHLDYHHTFDAYRDVKKSLFDSLPKSAFALTNIDDRNGNFMLQNTKAKKYSYGSKQIADFTVKRVEYHLDSTLLLFDGKEVWVRFMGDFNAYNLLAVYATASLLGFDKENILLNMSRLVPVAGRFETILSPTGIMAIVDYAHTPDALENVLKTIVELRREGGNIYTVVGAGGDRDRTKRPEMSETACRYSDRLILTSDNPRSEEPTAIIEEMYAGVSAHDAERVLCITDRREAIRTALMLAKKGDVVLIAGKGHENYQEIKGVRYDFDDKKVVMEFFKL